MDLAKINFQVETDSLKRAIDLVETLGAAVQSLGADVQVLAAADKNASAATLLQAKARRENATALKEEGKVAEANAKSANKVAESTNKLASAASTAEGKVSGVEKVLSRWVDKLEIVRSGNLTTSQGLVELGNGFTASQASAFAMLKSMGATEDQLKSLSKTLKDYNNVTGVNPFDASANGLARLRKEIQELERVNELSQRGFNITRDEVRLLSRDISALEQNYKAAGLSEEALVTASAKLTSEFVQQAQARNALVARSSAMEAQAKEEAAALGMVGQQLFYIHQLKQQQKQSTYQSEMKEMGDYYSTLEKQSHRVVKSTGEMDQAVQLYHKHQQAENTKTAKSLNYIEREFERAEKALEGLNEDLHVSTSNRLLKFEQQLRASGMEVKTQTDLLEKYKKTLATTDKIRSEKGHVLSRSESDKKVDYLARGLAPQISDVVVSLQGGMNPFTVLMQQGMQVRDLMQLSGVEAGRMGEAFQKAGQGMVTTTLAASKAIGSMLIGVIMDAGKVVTDLGLRATGTADKFERLRYALWHQSKAADAGTASWAKFGQVLLRGIPAVVGTALAVATAAVGAFAIGLYQVIQQENELARVLALNAGNLNISQVAAISYAQSFDAVSTSTSKVIDVLNAMAGAGSFQRSEFDAVIKSALEMQKYVGVAIEDTVKAFAKMKEDPVNALLELARTTGMVSPAVQQMVIELEQEGRTAEATALAVTALADVHSQQVGRMKEDLNGFSLFMKNLGADIANFFSGVFKDLFYKADPQKAIKKQLSTVKEILGGVGVRGVGVVGLGIGKDYYKEQERILTSRLSGLVRLQGEEEKATYLSTKNAKLNQSAYAAYNTSLSTTEKHQIKIRNLDKQINEARALGNTSALAHFEKAKRFEEAEFNKKNKTAKGATAPKTPEQKSEDTVYNKTLKDLERVRDAAMKAEVAAMDYSDVQKVALDIFNDPAFLGYYDEAKKVWVGYTEQQRIALANEVELAVAREQSFKAIQKAKESSNEVVKSRNEQVEQAFKELQSVKDLLRVQEEAGQLLVFESSLSSLISEERQKQLEIRKIELELEKQIVEIRAKSLTDGQKADQIGLAKRTADQRISNISTKAATDLKLHLIDGVTDGIMVGLIQGGEAGKKSLRDLIVAELQKPIRVFVQAEVSKLFGGGSGSDLVGQIGKYLGLSPGTLGSVGSALGTAFGASGTTALSEQSLMLAAQEYGLSTGTTAAIGAARTAAPYAVAGGVAYNAISNGYEMEGPAKIFADAVGNFAGVLGPAGVLITAGAGIVNRAFGRKLVGEGISAGIQGGQVSSVGTYKEEKGGWFRSDKITRGETDSTTVNQVTKDVEALRYQAMGMASALGLNSTAVSNFTGELKINYKGVKNGQEASARYTEGMDKLYVNMLKSSGGLDKFRRSGESVEQALQRMTEEANQLAQEAGYSAQSLTDTLVKAMTGQMQEADAGAAIGDIIVGSIYNALAMGFAEQITSSITGLIIQPLMTSILANGVLSSAVSQESINAVVQQAQAAINAFNQVLADPAVQTMLSEINNMTMEIAGLAVAPVPHIQAFGSSMQTAADDAAEAAKKIADERFGLETELMQALGLTAKLRERELAVIDESNKALRQQLYALEDAKGKYDAVSEAAKDTLSKTQEARDAIKSVFDLLTENVRALRNEVVSTANMSVLESRTLIANAINSGTIPEQDELQRAVDSLKNNLEATAFESQVAEDRARLLLSNDLDVLAGISGKQLTEQEQQITLLESTLRTSEAQLNALLGIETYSFDAAQAVTALNIAMANYTSAVTAGMSSAINAPVNQAPAPVAPSGGGYDGGYSAPEPVRNWTAAGYASKNPDLVAEYEDNHTRRGWPAELDSLDAYLRWHWENYGSKPSESRQFAKGGAFTNGIVSKPTMFNIGEMGEAGSEAVIPLSNVGGSLGVRAILPDMHGVIEELQKLRKEVTYLRAETRAVVVSTARTYEVLDNATDGGVNLKVEVVNIPQVQVIV